MKTGFIDWTDSGLNIYSFEKKAGKAELVKSQSVPIEGELSPSLLESFEKESFAYIYLSVPQSLLAFREITLPFSDKSKIRETISYELEGVLLGSITDYSIDHILVESNEAAARVLAVCIEKKKLQEIIDMLTSAGLEPKAVTSIDIRLAENNIERLIENREFDNESRTDAAGKEISDLSIDLRQNELSYQGDIERLKRKLQISSALLLILLILFGVNSLLSLNELKKEHSLLTSEVQKAYRLVFPEDRKIIDPGKQFRGNMNQLLKKRSALAGLPLLDILRDIATAKDSSIVLHEFNADGANLVIKGTANSFEEVESLRNSLMPLFSGVKVADSGTGVEKKIGFTITMQEKTI